MRLHPSFTAFGAATDVQRMLPLVRRGLDRAHGGPVDIQELFVPRAFAHTEGGFTIQYVVRVGTESGTHTMHLCGYLLGPDEAWPRWALRAGTLVDETLRVAVPVFPFDPELPVLADLMQAEPAARILCATAGDALGNFTGVSEPEVLAYRLGRRCVLRYRLRGGRVPSVIVKVVRRRRLEPMLAAARALAAASEAARDWTAHVYGVDAENGLQLFEEAPGTSLHDLVGATTFAPGCEAAGRGLAALQATPSGDLRPFGCDDALGELERSVHITASMFPEAAAGLHAARADVVARRPEARGAKQCLHRDFYDKQVLHARSRTTLIDWDNLAIGDPAQDHGNFLAHIGLRAAQEPRQAASLLAGASAFRRGYGDRDAGFESRSRWWQAATLVRLATLYALRPRWRHLPALLAERARATLAQASLVTALAALLLASVAPRTACAGKPEYMKIEPHVGQTLEIEGDLNTEGLFVAKNIEELPNPRRPQLRASVQTVDAKARVLRVLGLDIRVTEKTEAEDPDSLRVPLAALRPGHRVEISCAVDSDSTWRARRIRVHDVKGSNKVKGTITALSLDGVPPDTLVISGFNVLLDLQTKVKFRMGRADGVEGVLFEELAEPDARRAGFGRRGTVLAGGALLLRAQYRGQVLAMDDLALSTRFPSDESETQPEIRVAATGYWQQALRAHAQVRLRRKFVLASDRGRNSDAEVHLTQLYVLGRTAGDRRLAVQVGRQDFDEPREWIFDEYQDAVRVYAYGFRSLVLEGAVLRAVEPIKSQFETWTDFFLMGRWVFSRRSQAAVWALARSDRGARNRQPVWLGMRYVGRAGRRLRPWADLALVRGEDKGRTLRGWAVDAGATVLDYGLPWVPSLTAAYAVGSGDARTSDGVDGNFRQTGYEDNFGRLGGVGSLKYYGTLLDPELSNLVVATLGVGVRPLPDASVEIVGHSYRQNVADDRLRSNNLLDPPARPNGASDELGWGLDFLVTGPTLWQSFQARWTSSFFRPGQAFDPRREDAWLHKFELTANF